MDDPESQPETKFGLGLKLGAARLTRCLIAHPSRPAAKRVASEAAAA